MKKIYNMKNLLFTLALLISFGSFGQNTIETKYTPPEGYERTYNDAYSKFLREFPLKENNIVKYYDGEEKYNDNIWDAVFDYKTGTHRWHQCADAAIYLNALYNYENKLYNKLSFHFTNGDLTTYNDWLSGIDYKVDSNDTNKLIKYQSEDRVDNFETFLNWLTERVMLWAGTWSMENRNDVIQIDIGEMMPGDIFLESMESPSSPGHAVTVVDVVKNQNGKKKFILSQSYMPSQEQQILINPENGSVWYSLDEFKDVVTPQWSFTVTQLKRFNN
tara:strand:- start:19 stop:843 length:825 start_codon:yes stop_codon:yes gene_type:complete